MKTLEVLDKYRKIVGGLLKVDPEKIKFYSNKDLAKPNNFSEIGELVWDKPEDEGGEQNPISWSLGDYKITIDGKMLSTWKLYQLPHCCAIMVSCNVQVTNEFRGKRVGTVFNQLRQDIGRLLGYSCVMCTDIAQNTNQRKLLKTNGWKDIHEVKNKRTGNTVFISVINI